MQFPTTQEITHIVRNRVVDPSTFIARSFCPVVPEYAAEISYDILSPSFGMTAAHNLNSDPKIIDVPSMGTAKFGTGYWKETSTIKEDELLKARAAGSWNIRAGRQLVMLRSLHLDTRLETRIEWLIWQVMTTGFIIVNENNVKLNLNYGLKNNIDFSNDAARNWKNGTNSDPIGEFNAAALMYRGTGAKMKKVYLNQATAAQLVKNPAIQNLLKNTPYIVNLTVSTLPTALKLLVPDCDFIVYDGGYLDETKTFQLFIPDGVVAITGDGMPGEKMMDFATTISTHNGGLDKPQPGKFALIEDESQAAKNPHIDLTAGMYGLPRIYHPEWIITMKVFK